MFQVCPANPRRVALLITQSNNVVYGWGISVSPNRNYPGVSIGGIFVSQPLLLTREQIGDVICDAWVSSGASTWTAIYVTDFYEVGG
jgi:hypothetical protein